MGIKRNKYWSNFILTAVNLIHKKDSFTSLLCSWYFADHLIGFLNLLLISLKNSFFL
jgi:hypothetical protein